jgi:hypothetical protein
MDRCLGGHQPGSNHQVDTVRRRHAALVVCCRAPGVVDFGKDRYDTRMSGDQWVGFQPPAVFVARRQTLSEKSGQNPYNVQAGGVRRNVRHATASIERRKTLIQRGTVTQGGLEADGSAVLAGKRRHPSNTGPSSGGPSGNEPRLRTTDGYNVARARRGRGSTRPRALAVERRPGSLGRRRRAQRRPAKAMSARAISHALRDQLVLAAPSTRRPRVRRRRETGVPRTCASAGASVLPAGR